MKANLRAVKTMRDDRGALSVIEPGLELGFPCERCFWIHGAPVGVTRGGHAHRTQHQAIFCPAGAMSVLVVDRDGERLLRLDRPDQILHVPPMTWAEETALTAGTVWVVFSHGRYDRADYLMDRQAWSVEVGVLPCL